MQFTTSTVAAAAAFFATLSQAHMELSKPYAIRSKFDPANKSGGQIDYSMTSPLEASGSNYPCKGYQTDANLHSVATYTAGQQYSMELEGSATHNGGSCQLSLSYDGGKTFRVIKSMIGGCPLTKSYDFTIPSYAPNGTALFGWTWNNESGNREFYMNCAVVDIQSSTNPASSKTRRDAAKSRRDAFNSFDDLPTIWRANLADVNKCTTTEGHDPVYPHPGPDVVYGKAMSSSSPPDGQADCDANTPGPAYKGALKVAGAGEDAGGSGSSDAASSTAAASFTAGGQASATGGKAVASSAASSPAAVAPSTTPAASPDAGAGSGAGAALPSSVAGSAVGTPALPGATGAACSTNGAFQCTNGGKGFAVCDNGAWMDMGAVAAGMTCQDGNIVLDMSS